MSQMKLLHPTADSATQWAYIDHLCQYSHKMEL